MSWLYWSLASAVFAALTAIFAKIGVSNIDSNAATAIRTSMIVVITWMIALATRGSGSLSFWPTSTRTWVFLTLSALATGLSWVCYFRALQLGPASKVAPIDKLSVVFVIGLAALVLGEQVTLGKLAGGALIAAGAIILAWP